jgi:DNA-binding SARP family transcriptional activator
LLYRLRKLLGDGVIEKHKGHHTLDPRYCWLDAWTLESGLAVFNDASSPHDFPHEVLDLYQGPFLEGDDSTPVLLRRERIRSAALRAFERIGESLMAKGDHAQATRCYQQAIDADPLVESMHIKLMECHLRARKFADALNVYRRYRTILRSIMGIEPSEEMKALYREARAQSATSQAVD